MGAKRVMSVTTCVPRSAQRCHGAVLRRASETVMCVSVRDAATLVTGRRGGEVYLMSLLL